ncbi:MAG TPA: hypothetical protein VJG66_04045 [Patescibacteria group bacterium]|nr:hypothetical protein [Patescibacteria group bacterium]
MSEGERGEAKVTGLNAAKEAAEIGDPDGVFLACIEAVESGDKVPLPNVYKLVEEAYSNAAGEFVAHADREEDSGNRAGASTNWDMANDRYYRESFARAEINTLTNWKIDSPVGTLETYQKEWDKMSSNTEPQNLLEMALMIAYKGGKVGKDELYGRMADYYANDAVSIKDTLSKPQEPIDPNSDHDSHIITDREYLRMEATRAEQKAALYRSRLSRPGSNSPASRPAPPK